MIVLTSLVIGLVSLLITYKLKNFFTFHVFDIFIVMLIYYLLSFCVVCRYVLFVLCTPASLFLLEVIVILWLFI